MTTIGTLRNVGKYALRNVLTQLQGGGSALGHFNVADLVSLKAVVAGPSDTGLPRTCRRLGRRAGVLGTASLPLW